MNKGRYLVLGLVLVLGILLVTGLVQKRPKPALDSSLAPAYRLLGKPVKHLNRALTRVLPVGDLDEKAYGEAVAMRYEHLGNENIRESKYLNSIIHHFEIYKQKPFRYRVFVLEYDYPNAFAAPGGVIMVTRGLLNIMKTEGEIASILAHEMGHIERSHCLDAVRFKLLSKKMGGGNLGDLADAMVGLLLRHSFSKTQEGEADDYAYAMILQTDYDPRSVGDAFQRFLTYSREMGRRERSKANILRDYFLTHPPMELRAARFGEKAKAWWEKHHGTAKYRGCSNLKDLESLFMDHDNPEEWVRK